MRDNYQKMIDEMIETLKEQPAQVVHVVIAHDDWCNKLNGLGECNCNPIMQEMYREKING